MARQQKTRIVEPIHSPRTNVRIGSRITVGSENMLEVKHGKRTDYVTTYELIELIERRSVKKIIYYDSSLKA